jgi:hypothetical protein
MDLMMAIAIPPKAYQWPNDAHLALSIVMKWALL